MLVEQNSVMVEEREREIRQIVQSISDLNEIFRDLAGMVVEQVFEAVVTRSHTHTHTQLNNITLTTDKLSCLPCIKGWVVSELE